MRLRVSDLGHSPFWVNVGDLFYTFWIIGSSYTVTKKEGFVLAGEEGLSVGVTELVGARL